MTPPLEAARLAWRRLLPARARAALRGPAGMVVRNAVVATSKATPRAIADGPVIVSGFLGEGFGIGRAGRYTLAALERRGYRPRAHDLRPLLTHGSMGSERLAPGEPGGTWIVHCNPPEAVVAFSRIRRADYLGRYRIGYWAYELPRAPESWRRLAVLFDEIWVPSTFVRDALRLPAGRVRVMPHPVEDVAPARPRGDGCTIGAVGDFKSSVDRKNLEGAVRIFTRAFPEPDGQARLVVKTLGFDPQAAPGVAAALGRRADIELVDARLSDAEMAALLSGLDILLSPHRAEGFGLVLLETMARGIPALATGWSGNMDFMAALPELLIDYDLVRVADRAGIYPAGRASLWAEPDIADGAAKLRRLVGERETRARLSRAVRAVAPQMASAWDRQDLFTHARPTG